MGTYIVGGLLIAAVVGAVLKIRRDRKNSACGCGCSGCGSSNSCPSSTEE